MKKEKIKKEKKCKKKKKKKKAMKPLKQGGKKNRMVQLDFIINILLIIYLIKQKI